MSADDVSINNTYYCVANREDRLEIDKVNNRVRIVAEGHRGFVSVYMSVEDAESLMLSIAVILKQIKEEQEGLNQ